jgi:hypothetical protein
VCADGKAQKDEKLALKIIDQDANSKLKECKIKVEEKKQTLAKKKDKLNQILNHYSAFKNLKNRNEQHQEIPEEERIKIPFIVLCTEDSKENNVRTHNLPFR